MERQFSELSSRGNSELGSRFLIDSGCYMTSLAATIFIASLVTFGVLMITLVIALSTMLQSCENRSSGMVELQRLDESLSYCKILSLNSQLNSLQEEENELPLLCRDVALRRIKQGIYLRELNFTIQMALTFFQTIKPMNDNRDVVVIDIDEINLLLGQDSYYIKYIEEAKHQKSKLILELYSKLRSQGYSMVMLSRKAERERDVTIEQLKSRGYSDWSRLIMREDTREMEELKREYRVIGVIGNDMDVLTGQWNWQSKRLFKLPSLTYDDVLEYSER